MLEIFIIAQVREDDGLNQDIGNNDELEKFRKYIFLFTLSSTGIQ